VSCALCPGANAYAQSYPTKPVRILVPFAPGGGTDTQARLLGRKFQESMGQSFIVENRPGAAGVIGTEIVARSPGDGYILLVTSASHSINVSLQRKLAFDPFKDLAPASLISSAAQILTVHPSVPVRTVGDLVALAKKRPGQINAASSGSGTANHLAIEMLKQMAGISVTHVPYRGGAPALLALIGGEVAFSFNGAITALPAVKAGKVRPLAVTSLKRATAAPDLPTMDSFFPGFESANWYAVFLPGTAPAALVSRISTETAKAIQTPEIRDFISSEGAEPVGGTPQELDAYVRREVERYAKVVKAGNVKVD
jgi:tripartite-type tricarboxylate transporter receptor subunit TctC